LHLRPTGNVGPHMQMMIAQSEDFIKAAKNLETPDWR